MIVVVLVVVVVFSRSSKLSCRLSAWVNKPEGGF